MNVICPIWLQLISHLQWTCAIAYFEGFVWNPPICCLVPVPQLVGQTWQPLFWLSMQNIIMDILIGWSCFRWLAAQSPPWVPLNPFMILLLNPFLILHSYMMSVLCSFPCRGLKVTSHFIPTFHALSRGPKFSNWTSPVPLTALETILKKDIALNVQLLWQGKG